MQGVAMKNRGLPLIVVAALVAGCATPPSTNVRQPMTARPVAPQAVYTDGAIYQGANTRMSLFEDRRARNVGDTLTVIINENNNVKSQSTRSDSHTGNSNYTMSPNIFGPSGTANTNIFNSSASDKVSDSNQNQNSGVFTGAITVTVVDVLPNGNLAVSGEKQVAIDHKTEYLRLSGVVNPANVSGANTVSSTQVADAVVEYKGAESMDKATFMSMLTRFFMSVVPF
jgi:flagellar L-ring protein precursor FlgH